MNNLRAVARPPPTVVIQWLLYHSSEARWLTLQPNFVDLCRTLFPPNPIWNINRTFGR